jgi:hypothetical protein
MEAINEPELDLKEQSKRRTQAVVSWLPVLLAGLVGTWLFHIPQFASRFDMFPGDRGDARLVSYLLEHWYQVFRGNDNWLSPQMFYPVKGVIAYADLLFGYSIPYSILRTFGLGIFEASEFTIIVLNFLNYLVCFILLKKILRFSTFASCAAAFFFAFNSPKLVQMGHFQVQPVLFLPLAIIFVVMVVQRMETLSPRKAFLLLCLAALFFDLQLLSGFYLGWFFMLWSSLFIALALLFKRTRLFLLTFGKRFWTALIGAGLVLVVGLTPFFIAYLPLVRASSGRSYKEVSELIPVFWSLFVMGERNYLWGTFSTAIQRSHPLHPELQIGIGLIPSFAWLGVTALAVWLIKANKTTSNGSSLANSEEHNKTTHMFVALLVIATTLFYLLGMRYWNNYSPWKFIHSYFPGAHGIRAVARYVILLTLPMSIAFAFVIDRTMMKISLQNRRRVRMTMYAALFVVIAFGLGEQFARNKNFNGFSVKDENAYLKKLSAALPTNCSSFYVAIGPSGRRNQFEYQVDAAFVSIMTHVPTMNGYSGQFPPNWGLWQVKAPDYEANVKTWIDANHLQGNICRLAIEDPASRNNPIDDLVFFVRQQYLDLLAHPPDSGALADLSGRVAQCWVETDLNCGRVQVSLSILKSDEFQKRSNFVYFLYDATLGRPPRYEEFIADREGINVLQGPVQEAASKETFLSEWMKRTELRSRYEKLGDADFVNKLLLQAGIALADRDELIADLENNRKQQVTVLREVLESKEVAEKFSNRSLVAMQFLGFLRRDPTPSEFSQRLTTLEANGNYRQLIFDFIYSTEYRQRFGPVN